MKAIRFHQHGGVDVLKYEDAPDPKLGPSEVLVEVHACALNHLDVWVRQGIPGVTVPLPHILGCDIAGKVAALGHGVHELSVGQAVVIAPGINCGHCEHCYAGNDSQCNEFKIMGFQVDGGYAEFVKVPARNIIPISDKLSFEEWAPIPLVFLTAWHMLITRAGLKAGEDVLIHAAGSGVGSAAIQIARLAGARVITTVGSEKKLEKALALDAQEVINYTKADFATEVKRLTDGRGVDVVLEHIGPDTWQKSLASLAKGGRLVTCGATSGPQVTLDLRFTFMRQHSIHGCYMGSRRELMSVLKLVERGLLRPVVDSVFPLEQAAAAQSRMLERELFGKIVLKVR